MSALVSQHHFDSIRQCIRNLYLDQLGHAPGEIDCYRYGNQMTITIADATTLPERLLLRNDHLPLVKQIRAAIDAVLKPQLLSLVEEVTQVDVQDVLTMMHFETGTIHVIVLFR